MFSSDVFKNLDKEFRETLSNFVYEKMTEKTKIELNQNSKMSDLSTFLTKKYGGNNNISIENEEKYCYEIINYMIYDDQEFKDIIIKKQKN